MKALAQNKGTTVMFFDTRKVAELEGLSYKQRMQAIKLAYDNSHILQKAGLNTCKFALLAPVFFLIAKEQSWSVLPWILLTFLLYPIVTKPLTLYFVKGELKLARIKVLNNASDE